MALKKIATTNEDIKSEIISEIEEGKDQPISLSKAEPISLEEKEARLKTYIADAIKEELLAENMLKKAKDKVKTAKEDYSNFLTMNKKTAAMPLLEQMIK